MKNTFNKILDNSAILAGAAIVVAGGVMVLMFLVFEDAFDAPRTGSEVVSEFAEDNEALAEGDIYPIQIRSIPAPVISPNDGSVLGYVFLDVTLDVAGEEARVKAENGLDIIITGFTKQVTEVGVGKSNRPGEVDYDRLARMFLVLAQAEVGHAGVARVVIQASEEG